MKESAFANAGVSALAHKLYLQAAYDKDWIGMLICWAIILHLEGP
jgi:hypothetical protein